MKNLLLGICLMLTGILIAQENQKKDSLPIKFEQIPSKVIPSQENSKVFALRLADLMDFNMVDEAPIYPGCRGGKKALRNCFRKNIRRHIETKFEADLFNSLGLSPGIKKILILFQIDVNGVVSDIRVKAPHPKLAEESKRVMKLLPKFMPGKFQGKPVGVRYTLPFRFDVK